MLTWCGDAMLMLCLQLAAQPPTGKKEKTIIQLKFNGPYFFNRRHSDMSAGIAQVEITQYVTNSISVSGLWYCACWLVMTRLNKAIVDIISNTCAFPSWTRKDVCCETRRDKSKTKWTNKTVRFGGLINYRFITLL